ncbi:insulinase family protein, partial [Parabacteroides sp. OttesenSCG-928-N08]|nr:insulinase family protein [Parabacteroides sp. OttesenSCG-928-N08]
MQKLKGILCMAILLIGLASCMEKSPYSYESVPNDPMKSRIYTLDNGLKVYMTVNKETPRIQTYIAVRVGGKNDPAETTGLAHYFEHLMFKGTKQFGTQDYEKEKPLLDEIERLFEVYRKTTDEAERKAIYAQIDSVSYEASKLSIPNEYDKLMSAIGANGTNAYTGFDMTVYIEDIPSNQIDNWAKIQADRFENNVIRGFHTELETVYEEKNMSLTSDGRKMNEAMLAALFPDHPYGSQTVLGTQEHLKNPSIINIKNYHKIWYVPNNMAICLSGDFDPEQMIQTIDKYFGHMQPNNDLPKLPIVHESPVKEPVVKEVLGLDAENVSLGWRLPGRNTEDYDVLSLISNVMYNGKAGLIDQNITQQQRLLSSYAYTNGMADYSLFMMNGRPKTGQTLEEVKDILLAEVEKLKRGEFSEDLLEATINNLKLNEMASLEHNSARANMF